MKLAAAFLLLLSATVLMAGCGGSSALLPPPKPQVLHITWTSDGNPLVPVCVANAVAPINCKTGLTVWDQTAGTKTAVALTVTTFDAPSPTDAFEVYVNGYDYQGNAIQSQCCTVTVQ